MEKVADAGRSGTRKPLRLAACAALAVCGAVSLPGWAQQAGQAVESLVAQGKQPPLRMQVQASSLPQFEAQDSGFQSPRVDMTLYPSRRYGIGAMVGMSGFTQSSAPATAPYFQAPHANVDIGVRFSQRVQSQQIDIMAWRRMTSEDDAYTLAERQPLYGARVEMNLAPADKTGLTAASGFLGLQLEGGARISVRRSNGHPMVYYRRTF